MSDPMQLRAAIDEWNAERQHCEAVAATAEDLARQLDAANNKIALLTEQAEHEREQKEQAQRRVLTLEAQLATIATTTYDVGIMLSRIVGTTVEKIVEHNDHHRRRANPEAPADPVQIAGDTDTAEIPLFLRTAEKLPEVRL